MDRKGVTRIFSKNRHFVAIAGGAQAVVVSGTAPSAMPPHAAPPQPYGAPQQPYGAPQQPYGAPQQPFGAPQQQYPMQNYNTQYTPQYSQPQAPDPTSLPPPGYHSHGAYPTPASAPLLLGKTAGAPPSYDEVAK